MPLQVLCVEAELIELKKDGHEEEVENEKLVTMRVCAKPL
jgi:hypothetical protein